MHSRLTALLLILLCDVSLAGPRLKAGLNTCRHADGQLYYVHVPEQTLSAPKGARVLISIHGYSGREDNEKGRASVRRAATRWASLSKRTGWVVLAPQFDEKRFSGNYQRLNLAGKTPADARLDALLEKLAARLPGLRTDKLYLFGFSGGGQFVHRYAAFHPRRVERAVAGGAGWYMFPDPKLPYPIGTGSVPGKRRPDIRGLRGVRLLVIVGAEDTDGGAFRKRYEQYDLLTLQGPGRLQRARNWVDAVRRQSGRGPFRIRLALTPGTGHTISKMMRKTTEAFLTGR